jgi:hypothetical protein
MVYAYITTVNEKIALRMGCSVINLDITKEGQGGGMLGCNSPGWF